MRDLENVQADRIGPPRFVVGDKAFGLQGPQDVVGGPAMKRRGPGDLARIQRPLRPVQCAQDFDGCDDRAHRLASVEIARGDAFAARDDRHGLNALGLEGASC